MKYDMHYRVSSTGENIGMSKDNRFTILVFWIYIPSTTGYSCLFQNIFHFHDFTLYTLLTKKEEKSQPAASL